MVPLEAPLLLSVEVSFQYSNMEEAMISQGGAIL
jgi:hypothetical protein